MDLFEKNWGRFEKIKPAIAIILLILFIWLIIVFWKDPKINFYEDVVKDFFRGGSGGSPYGDPGSYYNE